MSPPKQSLMMEKLYGKTISKIVYDRCQALGEDFHHRVQEYVYDVIWAKPGIALKEKSLITVISLIVSNKAEQLKIHLWGLFYQGLAPEDLILLLKYMEQKKYIDSARRVLKILSDSKKEYLTIHAHLPIESTFDLKKNSREKIIIDFAAHIALGNNKKTEKCMRAILKNHSLSLQEMLDIMQHIAVYCGFPAEMNGLSVLYIIQQR